tara:strand:- start:62 stop:283 length:222 start_codon:yes stop_codon:yes gene_type:complete
MSTLILSFLIVVLVITAMAVGVIFSNKPIKGSCGGMGALGIDNTCDICGGKPKHCAEENQTLARRDKMFYDAS